MLARKWRPTTFDEVVGQHHVTQTLKNAIKLNRVAHALLFTGSRGIGKTSCARILAKALNCETGPTATPCGQCTFCKEITDGRSVDVFEVDGASNNSVEQIREIRESVKFVPASGRRKVYIIDEVHMLSTSAFNALLKTLEEPPEHVLFIFATTEPHKIPDTILSRCQRYDFKRISEHVLVDALATIAGKESIKIGRAALGHIAREAHGGMRDSLSLFDQVIAFSGTDISEAQVTDVLGIAGRQVYRTLIDAVRNGDGQMALSIVQAQHARGLDLVKFANELLRYVRDLMVIRVCPEPEGMVDLPADELSSLQAFVSEFTPAALHRMLNLIMKGADEVSRSSYPRISLEMTLLALCHQGITLPISEVLTKLDRLSRGLPAHSVDPSESPDAQPDVSHVLSPKDAANVGDATTEAEEVTDVSAGMTEPSHTTQSSSATTNREAQNVSPADYPPWEQGPTSAPTGPPAAAPDRPSSHTAGQPAKPPEPESTAGSTDSQPVDVQRPTEAPPSPSHSAKTTADSAQTDASTGGLKNRPSDENYDDFSATPPSIHDRRPIRPLAVKPRIAWAIHTDDVEPFLGQSRAIVLDATAPAVPDESGPEAGHRAQTQSSVPETESDVQTETAADVESVMVAGTDLLNLNDGRSSIEHLEALLDVIRKRDVFAASEMIQVVHLVRFDGRSLHLAMNAHHFQSFGQTCETLLGQALSDVGLSGCAFMLEPCDDGHPHLSSETIFARQQRLELEHRAHRKALVRADQTVNHALEVLGGELIDVKLCSPQTAEEN
ncbi:MAG: DNA polymerase III subunit gamma/tau [Myxococcota bacterium]|nr:DNA polymerase III subunit gamma/tau [Myxococcota bacterium]